MLISLVALTTGDITKAAPGDPWDLANFITGVTMEDPSTSPPTVINPGDTLYQNQNYIFTITFAEDPVKQLAYNGGGFLEFTLPSALVISSPIPASPIYFGNSTTRIGTYTISASPANLVQVRFDNVDNTGASTPGNFIDNYTNVQFRLQVTAMLQAGGGGDLGFGDIVITIPNPEPQPPSMNVTKTSQYDAALERINYIITIKAAGNTVNVRSFTDTLTFNPGAIHNPSDNNAFFGFRYAINGGTNFIPMSVNWISDTYFTYYFPDGNITGSGIMLEPGEYITIMFYVDIPTLIENNPPLDPLSYNFSVLNSVSAHADGGLSDTANVPNTVTKTFPRSKTGVFNPGAVPPSITWTITVGNAVNTILNGGTITDILDETIGSGYFLPDPSAIKVELLNAPATPIFDGFADAFMPDNFTLSPSAAPYTRFDFIVPGVNDPNPQDGDNPYNNIYQVIITFDTALTTQPPTRPGLPPTVYQNNLNFNHDGNDYGSVGRVPFTPPTVDITKSTSGICGNPRDGYYINYEVEIYVPDSLYEQPLWIYDTLGRLPGNAGVPNNPENFTIVATEWDGSPLPPPPGGYPPISGNLVINQASNEWRYYINTPDTNPQWPYLGSQEVKLTITYTVPLDQATVNFLKSSSSNKIQNTTYLINGGVNPVLSGNNQNSVGGKSINDSWPVFKTGKATNNPALFDYTVVINGAYSGRPNGLFQDAPPASTPKNPIFTEAFDSRLSYVPGSFYVWDSGTNKFYAPGPNTDVTPAGNGFNIHLNTLWEYTSPPAPTGSPTPGGTPIGSGPPSPNNWFANKRNYQVHYQLIVKNEFMEVYQPNLVNNAFVAVNPGAGQCNFDSSASVNYGPQQIGKTITPSDPGSNKVHVEIVINPDGGLLFSDGSSPAPTQVTARDELTNLLLFLDNITVYTQTKVGNYWDGAWKLQPITYNDRALWSANIVSTDVFDFVIPNQQPVKIVYDALVTLAQGSPGAIGNKMTIFGVTGEDGNNNYVVGDTSGAASADALRLRLFKLDSINKDPATGSNLVLPGATFSLYVADLERPGIPPYGITAPPITAGGISFYPLVPNQVTNGFGMASFENPGINSTFQFLFLLVETGLPPGYTPGAINPNPFENYTFFTVKPDINASMLSAAQASLNAAVAPGTVKIDAISDFITIGNTPDVRAPGSLRIWKMFTGIDITSPFFQQQLSNFRLTVTDPLGVVRNYTITDAMNPLGIVINNAVSGTYFIQEFNADVPGYNSRTTPPPPLRLNVIIDPVREVVIQMNNIYTIPIIELPPGIINPPTESLAVWKVLNFPTGTTSTQIEQNIQRLRNQGFAIVITGPNGFNESIGIDDALNGVVFEKVDEGTYFFSEINANIPGYSMTSNPQLPFRRYVMPSTAGTVTISITNDYKTPQPSPQTGINRSIALPIILLSAALICLGGAEFYRRRSKKSKSD